MNDIESRSNDASANIIESASASTACQTCDSKFAYILTASVLGVIALVAAGLMLLLITAFATMSTSDGTSRMDEGYHRYHDWDDDDFGWSEYPDELEELQAL